LAVGYHHWSVPKKEKKKPCFQKFKDGGLAGGGALTHCGSRRLPPKRNRGRSDPTDLNIKKERLWVVEAIQDRGLESLAGLRGLQKPPSFLGGGGLVSIEATFAQSRGMGRKEGEQGGGGIAVPGMANEGWR